MLMPHPQIVALTELARGRSASIVGLEAGRRLAHRLTEMGLYEGARVTVISNAGRGPLILALGTCRLALGRGMAEKIRVGPLPEES